MRVYFWFLIDFLKRRALLLSAGFVLGGLLSFFWALYLPNWQRASTTILLKSAKNPIGTAQKIAEDQQILRSVALWKNVLQRLQLQMRFCEKKAEHWQLLSPKMLPFQLSLIAQNRNLEKAVVQIEIDAAARHFTWSLLEEEKLVFQRILPLKDGIFEDPQFRVSLHFKPKILPEKRIFRIEWQALHSLIAEQSAHFQVHSLSPLTLLQLHYSAPTQEQALQTLKLILDEFTRFRASFGATQKTKDAQKPATAFAVLEPLTVQKQPPPFYVLWLLFFAICCNFAVFLEKFQTYFASALDFQRRNTWTYLGALAGPNTFAPLYFLSEQKEQTVFVVHAFAPNRAHFTALMQMARAWTQRQKKVLLIDAHLEHPQFQAFIEAAPLYSLRDYLMTEQMQVAPILTPYSAHLDLIYAEKTEFTPSLKRLSTLLAFGRAHYDAVLIYAPFSSAWCLSGSAAVALVDAASTPIAAYSHFAAEVKKIREKGNYAVFLDKN